MLRRRPEEAHVGDSGRLLPVLVCSVSFLTFGYIGKLCAARSRLSRIRLSQPNTRWNALDEIYQIHILLTSLIFIWSGFSERVCRNFRSNSRFSTKFKILTEIRHFLRNSRFSQKSYIFLEIRTFRRNSNRNLTTNAVPLRRRVSFIR